MLVACGPLLLPSGLCRCQPDAGLAAPKPTPVKACSHKHCHKTPVQPVEPLPTKHKPGCTAELADLDRSPAPESVAFTVAVLPVAIDSLTLTSIVRLSRQDSSPRVPTTPVYLSHCALVL